jgi:hypothetical protein
LDAHDNRIDRGLFHVLLLYAGNNEDMKDVRNVSVGNVLFALDMVLHAYNADISVYNKHGEPVHDWKFKYDFIFNNLYPKVLKPRLEDADLQLDWNDPDTSYEDDVRAFVAAVREFKEKLEAVAS